MTLYTKLQETLEEGMKAGYAKGKAQGMAEGMAEGKAQGMAEGMAQGDFLRLISQIRKKFEKRLSAEAAADMLEENPELVKAIMDLLNTYPELDNEAIYQKII